MSNINIYEIAKATGYSSSTVARALRENGVCNPQTRAHILKVAKEMGYVPNRAARTLRSNLTGKIMLCIDITSTGRILARWLAK